MRNTYLSRLMFCLLLGGAIALFSSQKTFAAPTTAPSSQRVSSDTLSKWFAALADADAAVRETARFQLMGISREDLPALRAIVKNASPIAPSQAQALREIVGHVVLASESYEQMPGRPGFLGVRFAPPPMAAMDVDETIQSGALIADRIPGFCAYRVLQNADVVVGIREAPQRPVRSKEDLSAFILTCHGGDRVHLQVLRGGQQVELAITLDARPAWAMIAPIAVNGIVVNNIPQPPPAPNANAIDQSIERQRIADEFWQKNFAPLLGEELF